MQRMSNKHNTVSDSSWQYREVGYDGFTITNYNYNFDVTNVNDKVTIKLYSKRENNHKNWC